MVNAGRSGTLVIHRGALGDVLGAVPSLQALRAAFPGEPLVLLTHPEHGRLLARCGLADTVRDVNAAAWVPLFAGAPLPVAVRAFCAGFARAIAWVTDPADTLAHTLRACGVPRMVVAPPFGPRGGRPHWRHLAEGLAALDVGPVSGAAALDLHADDIAAGRQWLASRLAAGGPPVLAVQPGSGSVRKNWPAAAFREVATRLRETGRARAVVLLGPAETERAGGDEAWNDVSDAIARNVPLTLLAGIARACAAWLGNDAGPTHLAAALGVPTVAVFGAASDPAVWTPRGQRVRVLPGTCGPGAATCSDEVASVLAAVDAFLPGAHGASATGDPGILAGTLEVIP